MTYSFRPGSRIKADPQVAGEMCERIREEYGELTAENLLDENRPEDAPLHKAFEWNDSIAAEEYRKSQARHIINSLITIAEPDMPPVRAYMNVELSSPDYKPIWILLSNMDDYANMLNTALREFRAFEAKYRNLSELKPLFDAASEINFEEKEDA